MMKKKGLFPGVIAFLVVGICLLAFPLFAKNPVELRLSSFTPPTHIMNTKVLQPWIENVEKQTNGLVKITLYPGSTLGSPMDQYDLVVRGAAHVSWGFPGYTPGRFPLTSVMDLPFMSPSAEIGSRIVQRLYDNGYLKSEFEDVKLLALGVPTSIDLHSKKKPVRTLEDLRGMRIRVLSPIMGKIIKKWGGVPVAMPATEIFIALDRGTIDAMFTDPLTLYALKCNEVTEYHTNVGIASSPFFFIMNKETWDQLPADVKEIIDGLSGEYFSADLNGRMIDELERKTWKRLEMEGHSVYTLSPEERERWKISAETAIDEWVRDMEQKELPGSKVLEEALRLKEEFSGN
jgi:TRAP-type C4-dicarboxylate transport system substrate-binding protein